LPGIYFSDSLSRLTTFDTKLPSVLAALHELEFDYNEGDGIDYEPFEEFFPAEENTDWIRAWTGNQELTGAEYRIFGQDGTGGYAAFWLVHKGKDVLEQPIVFFGSEGEKGVVAVDFADLLWLFADGVGPMEAIEYGADEPTPNAAFVAFATEHAPAARKSGAEVLKKAQAAFPDFESEFDKLIKY